MVKNYEKLLTASKDSNIAPISDATLRSVEILKTHWGEISSDDQDLIDMQY